MGKGQSRFLALAAFDGRRIRHIRVLPFKFSDRARPTGATPAAALAGDSHVSLEGDHVVAFEHLRACRFGYSQSRRLEGQAVRTSRLPDDGGGVDAHRVAPTLWHHASRYRLGQWPAGVPYPWAGGNGLPRAGYPVAAARWARIAKRFAAARRSG